MAFEEDIRLRVTVEGLEKGLKKIGAAVDRIEKKNVGFTEAEKSAQRLLRTLEKIENAALSKLPTQVQILIAYLKAANKGMAEISARTAVAIAGFGQLGRVNFAPIIRQLQQTRDLLFEIQQVRIKFLDMPTGMRSRLSGSNPFQYLLDGLDLVKVRIIETQRLLDGLVPVLADLLCLLPGASAVVEVVAAVAVVVGFLAEPRQVEDGTSPYSHRIIRDSLMTLKLFGVSVTSALP